MALRDISLPEPSGPVPPAVLPLAPADRERLLAGAHHDPHALLGAHPVPGGTLFRALRPFARAVSVLVDGARSGLVSEGEGLFSAVLPHATIPVYTLLVEYEDAVHETADPYCLLPALGELDLHLIGEGRHEQLWRALGAEPMTHQGVTGTRFTVWAPNARGVRVTGDFTGWDGTQYPMRSLGSSGVW
ncbi:GlgB N-terminal domain-containing protein, partial [Streptomyces sp. NPDC004752]